MNFMRRITEITKRDIFDLLIGGVNSPEEGKKCKYISWYGRLGEILFLKRLYDLVSLPSYDGRFENAEGDIWQHRVNNDDWYEEWIFEDSRFGINDGEDETLLNFLCEIFHPVVRNEEQPWREFLNLFNQLLKKDGYELYEKDHISGRSIYGWRDITTKNIVIEQQAESLTEKFNSEYLSIQIKTMNEMIEKNPYDAIGKAKELLESCYKTILKENSVIIENDWDVIRLTKEACKFLKLTPDSISDTVKASDTIKKLLGNLAAISQSMAELRNSYGSGHGKDAHFKGLSPRHARLAVGSAVTAVYYIWETYEEQQARCQPK
jgi:hypothetical protein